MKKGRVSGQTRFNLDQRFCEIGSATRFAAPVRGWVRAIRGGLGMSSAQLASRLGVKQPTVIALEQSEAKGTVELRTLRRAAAALDCTLVYALLPNKPLDTTVRERARALARSRRTSVEHSMLLEDQAVSTKDSEAQLDEFVRELNPARLWDEM